MIIKLPHVEAMDTLNLPGDFKEQVELSFAKFTEMTAKEFTEEDRLTYIDNLSRIYTGSYMHDSEQKVLDRIKEAVEYEITENDDFPDKSDFWNFGFMCECHEMGVNGTRFKKSDYEGNCRDNSATMRVIAEIIRIVMNWKGGDAE